MNGIEILASEEVAIAWETWNWTGFWAVGVIALIAGLVGAIVMGLSEDSWRAFFGMLLFIPTISIALIGTLIALTTDGKPTEYETQYKVTISDEVNFNEFTEKYEIIDQEGKIYTIRERDLEE